MWLAAAPLPAISALLALPLLAAAAAGPPRTALVHVVEPPAVEGYRQGLLAAFSSDPTAGKELTAGAPPGDPLGCDAGAANGTHGPQVYVVRRGNCTVFEKVMLAKGAGAEGIFVVSDDESVTEMGGGGRHQEDVGILAVTVPKSLGDKILAQEKPVLLTCRLYTPGQPGLAEPLIVTLATALVAAGAVGSEQGGAVVEVGSRAIGVLCLGGSALLLVFYFLAEGIVFATDAAFALAGVLNFAELGSLALQRLLPALRGHVLEVGRCALRVSDLLALLPSAALGLSWLLLKSTSGGWLLQDAIAAAFLCWLQRIAALPNLKAGALLLAAALCFDAFWLNASPLFFGESVLAKAADSGAPLLLRVPAFGDPLGKDRLLGFGDIAIPGLQASFLRRHDVLGGRTASQGYFGPALLAYFLGLWASVGSLLLTKASTPTLLFLVPCTLGTTAALAAKRGELGQLWHAQPVAAESARQVNPLSGSLVP